MFLADSLVPKTQLGKSWLLLGAVAEACHAIRLGKTASNYSLITLKNVASTNWKLLLNYANALNISWNLLQILNKENKF